MLFGNVTCFSVNKENKFANDTNLGTCQKLAGGEGGGNFKFGFGNKVTHPCNGSEIC